jgi:hypothetical protein
MRKQNGTGSVNQAPQVTCPAAESPNPACIYAASVSKQI